MARNYIQLAICKMKGSKTVKVFEAPSFSVKSGDQVISDDGTMYTVLSQMNCAPESEEALFVMTLTGTSPATGFDRLAGSVRVCEYEYAEEDQAS